MSPSGAFMVCSAMPDRFGTLCGQMRRAHYSNTIARFLADADAAILGRLVQGDSMAVEATQRDAWLKQFEILKVVLAETTDGSIYFEYVIPRLGRRIDAVVLLGAVVFVLEFKVGEASFTRHGADQVLDYALDLKHFHEASHDVHVAPILVATDAPNTPLEVALDGHQDKTFNVIRATPSTLNSAIQRVLDLVQAPKLDRQNWENARYCPTPTIVEAATALYGGHQVEDISRSDAGARNLTVTSATVADIIHQARASRSKVICFVTGVPGAGKTLVGLDIATKHFDKASELYSVFLSGNGPLVSVLCEALARDQVRRHKERGEKVAKKRARSKVQAFIQNVHHFRDEYLRDLRPPVEHVALFDEAQRAWNLEQTAKFMRQKKGVPDFALSEPAFLISCLDRHEDWAVVVCLVGGGQEINTGEAGIGAWLDAALADFPQWQLCLSSRLTAEEYGAGAVIDCVRDLPRVQFRDDLHLGVSMRSFRAEAVADFVKQLLDLDATGARQTLRQVVERYPLALTRRVDTARQWLRERARGTERFGLVVSSHAQRLRPHAIDVRAKINPVHWFLHGKDDVRSSFYLEDAATEFDVQGLEVDWAGVVWDGDLRHNGETWGHFAFKGKRWQHVRSATRRTYLKNAYRVLLTRARQGMIVVVPEGERSDHTRDPKFYDDTYNYLLSLGISEVR
ncbi:DUF2075 domain-containing protein [soil metagenome]